MRHAQRTLPFSVKGPNHFDILCIFAVFPFKLRFNLTASSDNNKYSPYRDPIYYILMRWVAHSAVLQNKNQPLTEVRAHGVEGLSQCSFTYL